MWNSNLVSTLQSESSSVGSPASNTPEGGETGPKKPRTSVVGGGNQTGSNNKRSNSSGGGTSSNKSKSKLSRVRYFLHPGEPAVGQIVSDSLTDGQDNNNTLSLKQPQVNVYSMRASKKFL